MKKVLAIMLFLVAGAIFGACSDSSTDTGVGGGANIPPGPEPQAEDWLIGSNCNFNGGNWQCYGSAPYDPDKNPACCGGGTPVCRDLNSDHENCGSCGNACAAARTCCNGVCRDLLISEGNCGACGNDCEAWEQCQNGVCRQSCTNDDTGQELCPFAADNGFVLTIERVCRKGSYNATDGQYWHCEARGCDVGTGDCTSDTDISGYANTSCCGVGGPTGACYYTSNGNDRKNCGSCGNVCTGTNPCCKRAGGTIECATAGNPCTNPGDDPSR